VYLVSADHGTHWTLMPGPKNSIGPPLLAWSVATPTTVIVIARYTRTATPSYWWLTSASKRWTLRAATL
jgi:uncharacterized protein YqjF (DUF2071 family)